MDLRPLPLLVLTLALASACGSEQPEPAASVEAPTSTDVILVDQVLLADLLGEAIEVTGDRVSADGLLVRLAFEPLIRQTGPVSLQLMQSTGYRLLGVAEGSPLWQLGLREGDVLTSVDGEPIIGREHELRSKWERRPMTAEIGYLRGEEKRTLSLRVRAGAAWRGTDVSASLVTRPPVELPSSNSEFEPNIRCDPGTPPDLLAKCEVDRSTLDRLRGDPSIIVKQLRIVPNSRDGEVRGYKLYGMRAAGVPAMLGLQNGDLLMAVNGHELTSIDSTMGLFTQLANESKFELTIERRGSTSKLEITIVDTPKP